MSNYLTLSFLLKLITGVTLVFVIMKTIKYFITFKFDTQQESKQLIYIFENFNILEFDENIDIYFTKRDNILTITNGLYIINISQDIITEEYEFTIDEFTFRTSSIAPNCIKITQNQKEHIDNVIKILCVDGLISCSI